MRDPKMRIQIGGWKHSKQPSTTALNSPPLTPSFPPLSSLPPPALTVRMPWQKRYGLSRHGGPINERGPFRRVWARLTRTRRGIRATHRIITGNERRSEDEGEGEEFEGEIHFGCSVDSTQQPPFCWQFVFLITRAGLIPKSVRFLYCAALGPSEDVFMLLLDIYWRNWREGNTLLMWSPPTAAASLH